jgi:hypothetical protein
VKDHSTESPTTDSAYAAPAIERREDVTGLLGATQGSYCPPSTTKHYF